MTQITDSDREAAADIWRDYVARVGEIIVEKQMRQGGLDDGLPTRLAEHRTQSTTAMSAELDALREDVERSEKHRNDLADRNTSLSIENGALKATIAQLRDRVAKFAEILETVLPYTEAERLREEADVRCGRTYRNPIQKAVNKARALLTQNEVG